MSYPTDAKPEAYLPVGEFSSSGMKARGHPLNNPSLLYKYKYPKRLLEL
jgi:hypothetical protein